MFRIRTLFLKAVLRQDIGWYDTHPTGSFASRMADDLSKLQDGIGEKIGMFIYFMTIFAASIVNAFVHGWELALVIMATMPVLVIAVSICARATAAFTEKEMNIYGKVIIIGTIIVSIIKAFIVVILAIIIDFFIILNVSIKAGAIAEEVLSAIRTVVAFGGETREIER